MRIRKFFVSSLAAAILGLGVIRSAYADYITELVLPAMSGIFDICYYNENPGECSAQAWLYMATSWTSEANARLLEYYANSCDTYNPMPPFCSNLLDESQDFVDAAYVALSC